jgi:hypothetical protein
MKKTLTVMALLAGAASVYSQGEIGLSDYGNPNFSIQIFGSQGAAATTAVSFGGYSGNELMGQSPNGDLLTPGTTTYGAGTALGTGYSVELLAGPNTVTSVSGLTPTAPIITTWYTAAGGNPATGLSGFWNSVANATISTVPGGTTASVALAAWNNEGGTVTSLAAAQAAGDPWGVSALGTSAPLGAGIATPPNLPSSITSFSLVSTIPEPSTIALGVIGASAFLMRLRRKQ